MKDEFLSEEDLDLANLGDAEFYAYWDLWLHQAQATNHLDAHLYSHGVFVEEPPGEPTPLEDREQRLLAFLLDGPSDVLIRLRKQVAGARVLRRSVSVGGFWVQLQAAPPDTHIPGRPSFSIDDVRCNIEGLARGMRLRLRVQDGVAAELEGYMLGEILRADWVFEGLQYLATSPCEEPLIQRPDDASRQRR